MPLRLLKRRIICKPREVGTVKHRIVLAVVVLSICVVGRPAFAQRPSANGPSGIISESGSSVIEKDAEFMRMHVALQAKGDSLEAALAALKERICAARTKLGELVRIRNLSKSAIRRSQPANPSSSGRWK